MSCFLLFQQTSLFFLDETLHGNDPFLSYRDASTRLVDTGLSCVAFALLIGDYMAKSDAGTKTGLMWIFGWEVFFFERKMWVFLMWMFPKIVGFPPKSSISINRVFHCNPSILGCFPIFGNTHVISGKL